ncbi:hypothetical protein [Cellulomonas iranensis]|uniref:hypothetical protein n=1 Tax=Cellulomonas iranensis TaxID=76862 RepID=UPI0013D50FFA|nr:hypothetical protein [Cellulomonas iranensis]
MWAFAQGWDPVVVATWGAAAVSLIGAAIVLWVRWRDRPQADWVVLPDRPFWTDTGRGEHPGTWDLQVRLMNCGDGPAYRVVLRGVGCHAFFVDMSEAEDGTFVRNPRGPYASVAPGEVLEVKALLDAPQQSARPHLRDAMVTVTWLRTPTRHRREMRVAFDFASFLDIAQDDPSELLVLKPEWRVTQRMPAWWLHWRRKRRWLRGPIS